MSYKFAIVDWVDSCAQLSSVWWREDTIPDDAIAQVRSVGYVVRKNRMEIVLVSGVSGRCLAQPFAIPMGCIKRVKYVRLPK